MTRRYWRHVGAGALLLGALTAAPVASAAQQSNLAAARQALKASDYAQAISELDAVLAKQPENRQARFLLGMALAGNDNTARAVKVFIRLTQAYPDMTGAWNNLGVLYGRQDRLQLARNALEKAVKLDPGYGPAQENLGDIYVALANIAYAHARDNEKDNAAIKLKSQKLAAFLQSNTPIAGQAGATGASHTAAVGRAAAPTETATRAAPSGGTPKPAAARAAIKKVLKRWARAQSNHEIDAYLGAYSDNFQPPGGQSMADWVRARRQRLQSSAAIQVTLSDIQVTLKNSLRAVARFDERYTSDTDKHQKYRTMTLVYENGGWRIKRVG